MRLGQIRRDQGRLTEAAALFRGALTLDPGLAEAWLYLSELERFEPTDIDCMEGLLSRVGDGAAAVPLLFALGKAYDDHGEYDRAFARLGRGNRLMAARMGYDPVKDEAWADRILAGFDAKLFTDRAGQGDPSPLPIFILGMPRSGSTLAEQILASHPAMHGAGEIADVGRMLEDLARLHAGAADYVAACRTAPPAALKRVGAASVTRLQALAPGKERVTNKTPGNVFHIGFVHLVLPEARFLETRRDPVETCFACWRMLFRNGVAFSYDLAHLGRYYKLHDRLMRHWRELLPERVFTLSYEDLIADQENVSRRLIAFTGLDWNPACLDFHRTERPVLTASGAQVRQPLAKTPSQRWRNYERHLGPLFDALGADALSNPSSPSPARVGEGRTHPRSDGRVRGIFSQLSRRPHPARAAALATLSRPGRGEFVLFRTGIFDFWLLDHHSSTTLPECRSAWHRNLSRIPRSKAVGDDRRDVEPALEHGDHLVPGLEHLAAVDALEVSPLKMTWFQSIGDLARRECRAWRSCRHDHVRRPCRRSAAALPDISRPTSKPSLMPSSASSPRADLRAMTLTVPRGADLLGEIEPVIVDVGDHDVAGADMAAIAAAMKPIGPAPVISTSSPTRSKESAVCTALPKRIEDGGDLVRHARRQMEGVGGGNRENSAKAPGTIDADAHGVAAEMAPAGTAVAAVPAGDMALARDAVARPDNP